MDVKKKKVVKNINGYIPYKKKKSWKKVTSCKDFYLNKPIRLFCSIGCDKNKIDKRPVFLS